MATLLLLPLSSGNAFVQELSYSFYGGWYRWYNGNTAFDSGAFAGGSATLPSAIPTSGTATYTGTVFGSGSSGGVGGEYFFAGNAQLSANFGPGGSGTVTSTFSGLSGQGQFVPAFTPGNITGTETIAAGTNRFTGTVTGTSLATALTGTLNGAFYGPTAQEAAGSFKLTGAGNAFQAGAFGAHQ